MCEYKGKNDPTRVCSAEWSEEEYERALSRITEVAFSSLSSHSMRKGTPHPRLITVTPLLYLDISANHALTPCLQTFKGIVDWLPPPTEEESDEPEEDESTGGEGEETD
jgi:hypothetical protein